MGPAAAKEPLCCPCSPYVSCSDAPVLRPHFQHDQSGVAALSHQPIQTCSFAPCFPHHRSRPATPRPACSAASSGPLCLHGSGEGGRSSADPPQLPLLAV
ncbi:hypothetical protein GJAV_G00000080, partial [Gymnothorax javanicus]